jgi:surface antigen
VSHAGSKPTIRWPWALVSVLALCICASPAASAGATPLALAFSVSANSEGAVNQLTVTASASPGDSCGLHVTARGRVRSFSRALVSGSGTVSWEWEPASPPSQSPWTFVVTCKRGPLFAWRRASIELGFASKRAAPVTAQQPGETCDTQGVCFAADPFPIGQCTWYAEGRRPDLLHIVRGNAGEWLAAAKGHVPEGSRAAVGALAVWLPGVGHAGALGHVAYVAAVSGGRILVDDSNWTPTPTSYGLEVHEHWEPATSPSGYIYGGPAGAG